MPKGKLDEAPETLVEEEQPEERKVPNVKGKKKVLVAAKEDEDVFQVLLASDAKLAALYLLLKKATEETGKTIVEAIVPLLSQQRDSEVDEELKRLLIEELKEERQTRQLLKQQVLPMLMQLVTQIFAERKRQECMQMRLQAALLKGEPFSPELLNRIAQECSGAAPPVASFPVNSDTGGEEDEVGL